MNTPELMSELIGIRNGIVKKTIFSTSTSRGQLRLRPSPNIRVTRGKVSSHNFAFSPADTKSIEISGLPEQEKVVPALEISPFGDSAKSKRVVSCQPDITRQRLARSAVEKAHFYRGFL